MTCENADSRRGGGSRENQQAKNLTIKCVPLGTIVEFGVDPGAGNSTVSQAELRIWFRNDKPEFVDLRTPVEGGTFIHNGTDMFLFPRLAATWRGCVKRVDFGGQGTPYYAWRVKSDAGWSDWSDGNKYPTHVIWYCTTQDGTIDSGPPADWTVCLNEGITPDTWIVQATRPATNGRTLLFWAVQIKDASTGAWRALDANAGAAVTYYDGAAISHTIIENPQSIRRDSGTGFGTASLGDLVLMDVRGGAFDVQHCQWGLVNAFLDDDGNEVSAGSATTLLMGLGTEQALVLTDIRIRIVKPPWAWTTEGYLGGESNHGIYDKDDIVGDESTQLFVSQPIEVPGGVVDVEARVWFQNMYSRSDDSLNTSGDPCSTGGGSGVCGTASAKEVAFFTTPDEVCGSEKFQWWDDNATLLAIGVGGLTGDLTNVYDSGIFGYGHTLGNANIDESILNGAIVSDGDAAMFAALIVADPVTLGSTAAVNYSLVTGNDITLDGPVYYSWLGGQTLDAVDINNSVIFAGSGGFTGAATAHFTDCHLVGSGFDFENDWTNIDVVGFGYNATVNSGAHLDQSFFFGDTITYDGNSDNSAVFALATYDPDTTFYWGGHVMTDIKGLFVCQGNGAFWRISGTAADGVTADNSGGDLAGQFIIRDLPVGSDPGVPGALWVDGDGFVKYSALP